MVSPDQPDLPGLRGLRGLPDLPGLRGLPDLPGLRGLPDLPGPATPLVSVPLAVTLTAGVNTLGPVACPAHTVAVSASLVSSLGTAIGISGITLTGNAATVVTATVPVGVTAGTLTVYCAAV
ncbi:hypothetical protein [Streptomyces mirabilis]|uniref:hypothetical protein n=1 Tax=Streptomyces mirabilis TaxID=68239 RepID=UPI0033AF84B1